MTDLIVLNTASVLMVATLLTIRFLITETDNVYALCGLFLVGLFLILPAIALWWTTINLLLEYLK